MVKGTEEFFWKETSLRRQQQSAGECVDMIDTTLIQETDMVDALIWLT